MIYPLMLCSLVSLAVVYERFISFRASRKVDNQALRSKVLSALRAGNHKAAVTECISTGGPVASVLLVGLRSYVQLKAKKENSDVMRMVVGQVHAHIIAGRPGQLVIGIILEIKTCVIDNVVVAV